MDGTGELSHSGADWRIAARSGRTSILANQGQTIRAGWLEVVAHPAGEPTAFGTDSGPWYPRVSAERAWLACGTWGTRVDGLSRHRANANFPAAVFKLFGVWLQCRDASATLEQALHGAYRAGDCASLGKAAGPTLVLASAEPVQTGSHRDGSGSVKVAVTLRRNTPDAWLAAAKPELPGESFDIVVSGKSTGLPAVRRVELPSGPGSVTEMFELCSRSKRGLPVDIRIVQADMIRTQFNLKVPGPRA